MIAKLNIQRLFSNEKDTYLTRLEKVNKTRFFKWFVVIKYILGSRISNNLFQKNWAANIEEVV